MAYSTKSEHCPKKTPSRKNKVLTSFKRPTIASTFIPVDKIVKECNTSNPVIINLVEAMKIKLNENLYLILLKIQNN